MSHPLKPSTITVRLCQILHLFQHMDRFVFAEVYYEHLSYVLLLLDNRCFLSVQYCKIF